MSNATNLLWFAGVLAALVLLFAAGLRLPVPTAAGSRIAARISIITAAVAVAALANIALYRHDAHLDLTRERAFTASEELRRIVDGLTEPVSIWYFYQAQNPAARALNTILQQLPRRNARVDVRVVDADRNPALAGAQGVRMYNAAILRAGDRRIEVITTDDREIGLGLLRLLRRSRSVICFATGHGEYDPDNFEFHTHFEGKHAHSHDAQGTGVVQMEQHGLGRLRRALEKLGLLHRKVSLATEREVPQECAAFVMANPRTALSPPESAQIAAYLRRGGSAMFLLEPDYSLDLALAEVLSAAGVQVREGFIVDPLHHYFTDEQMLAITSYGAHPVTRGLALSFYPGARPLAALERSGVRASVLAASSAQSYVLADRLDSAAAKQGPRSAFPIAVASEGMLGEAASAAAFRLLVFGDADFASNSFFPYLSNADVLLAGISWLIREERAPAMKPASEVLPTVSLTNSQMRGVFIVTVVLLPGVVALAGAAVWWLRR
jgi:hypothetical protein